MPYCTEEVRLNYTTVSGKRHYSTLTVQRTAIGCSQYNNVHVYTRTKAAEGVEVGRKEHTGKGSAAESALAF